MMNKKEIIYEFKPMFNVKPYEYEKVINKLSSKYKSSDYFSLLNKKVEKFNKDINSNINDHIITQFVKCRPNCSILTIWPQNNLNIKNFMEYISEYGNVYYYKKISLSYKEATGLVYQLYYNTNWLSIKNIHNKLRLINYGKREDIHVIVFENNSKYNLSGKNAELKMKFRNKIKELVNKDVNLTHVLHVNDHYYQTVEYSNLYFNRNSLNMLKFMNLQFLLNHKLNNYKINFDEYKKYLYSHSQLEQNNLALEKGALMYPQGKEDFLKNNQTTFLSINLSKIENKELILNPYNFLYFCGVKILIN